ITHLGAPGAGKGSLCKKLAENYHYHHLSVGDLLREQCRLKRLRPEATQAIGSNVLIDVEDLIPILRGEVERLELEGKKNIVIDGVPRVLEQAGPIRSPDLVFLFNCPEKIARQRFMTRNIPGQVDDRGTFDQRYCYYIAENARIIEYYRRRGVLVEVDG
ncbi:P-loop containing nucleoside triphosphate hydrolase protein, partial [Aspergillus sclerotioniger CBS 115572]